MREVLARRVSGSARATTVAAPQLRVVVAPEWEVSASADPSRPDPAGKTAGMLEPTEELLAEMASVSADLEQATPQEILRWAVTRFAPRFTMATAFGPEGMTLIHMLAEIAPETPIFNLDTGYQFAETLELRERVKDRYGIAVALKRPALNGGRI